MKHESWPHRPELIDRSSAFNDGFKPARLAWYEYVFIYAVLLYIAISCLISTPAWIVHYLSEPTVVVMDGKSGR